MKNGDPYKNPFNDWLSKNALWIALAVVAILLLIIVVLLILNFYKKSEQKTAKSTEKPVFFCEFVGGKDNIVSSKMTGSRITLELKNYDLVDEQKLKENKIISIIKLSNKITLVCDKSDVSNIYKSFN